MAIHPAIPSDYQPISADSDFFWPLTLSGRQFGAPDHFFANHFSANFCTISAPVFAPSKNTPIDYQPLRKKTAPCVFGAKATNMSKTLMIASISHP